MSNSNIEKLSVITLASNIMISLIHQESLSILFTETVQPNRVIYDFYDYDPYQLAANNAKALKDHIEQNLTLKSKVPVLFTLVMVQLISFKVLKKEINMLIQFQQNLRYDVLLAKP